MKTLERKLLCQIVGGQAAAVAETAGPSRLEVGATAAGLGGGVGASIAIESAGGVAALGAASVGVLAAAGTGLVSSWYTGQGIGTLLYENSETVQDVAQAAVGWVVESFQDVSDYHEGIGEHSCTYGVGGKPTALEADISQI